MLEAQSATLRTASMAMPPPPQMPLFVNRDTPIRRSARAIRIHFSKPLSAFDTQIWFMGLAKWTDPDRPVDITRAELLHYTGRNPTYVSEALKTAGHRLNGISIYEMVGDQPVAGGSVVTWFENGHGVLTVTFNPKLYAAKGELGDFTVRLGDVLALADFSSAQLHTLLSHRLNDLEMDRIQVPMTELVATLRHQSAPAASPGRSRAAKSPSADDSSQVRTADFIRRDLRGAINRLEQVLQWNVAHRLVKQGKTIVAVEFVVKKPSSYIVDVLNKRLSDLVQSVMGDAAIYSMMRSRQFNPEEIFVQTVNLMLRKEMEAGRASATGRHKREYHVGYLISSLQKRYSIVALSTSDSTIQSAQDHLVNTGLALLREKPEAADFLKRMEAEFDAALLDRDSSVHAWQSFAHWLFRDFLQRVRTYRGSLTSDGQDPAEA